MIIISSTSCKGRKIKKQILGFLFLSRNDYIFFPFNSLRSLKLCVFKVEVIFFLYSTTAKRRQCIINTKTKQILLFVTSFSKLHSVTKLDMSVLGTDSTRVSPIFSSKVEFLQGQVIPLVLRRK